MIKFCVICVVAMLVFGKHQSINADPIETDIASDKILANRDSQAQSELESNRINATKLNLNLTAALNATDDHNIISNQTSFIPPSWRRDDAQLANEQNVTLNSSSYNGFTLNKLKNEIEILHPVMPYKEEEEVEEKFVEPSIKFDTNEFSNENIETKSNHLEEHHLLIIIGILVFVLCMGLYSILIVWRARLEKRYGMRELLVTHDDYYNNNDIRHFSL